MVYNRWPSWMPDKSFQEVQEVGRYMESLQKIKLMALVAEKHDKVIGVSRKCAREEILLPFSNFYLGTVAHLWIIYFF